MGKKVDSWPIQRTLIINAMFFSLSLILLALSITPYTVMVAIFFMRLFGQGVLTLTSTATTIKLFNKNRGSALSITQLGYPLSEFIFPSVAILLLSMFGWRISFIAFALLIMSVYLLITSISIRPYHQQISTIQSDADSTSQSLSGALTDIFFPFYIVLSTIPPVMMTATLYFQVSLFNLHQWPIKLTAAAIFLYAFTKFIFTIIVGPILDKIGPVIPFILLTFFIGFATLMVSFDGPPLLAFAYYSLYGVALGLSACTMSYLWAKLYGSAHIGEIKGFVGILRNGGTAIAPITFSC